jgi:hypothetical protein
VGFATAQCVSFIAVLSIAPFTGCLRMQPLVGLTISSDHVYWMLLYKFRGIICIGYCCANFEGSCVLGIVVQI